MGTYYHHLTLEDRCIMAHLQAAGRSIRQIATALDRSPSTVARELTRNRSRTQGYQPRYAEQQARARRWRGRRLDRDAALRTAVLAHLQQGWTPEQIAGRWAREAGRPVLAPETIYRFLYAQIPRTKTYEWRHYLPQAKGKRGRRRTRRSPTALIPHRRSLADRPPGKAAAPIAQTLARLLAPWPPHGRQTVTCDNGTEFARQHPLHALGIKTFFCDPHAPWQKGGVEPAIGRLRRTLPRKTDLATLSAHRFHRFVHAYKHTPRQCLGYATPAEVFIHQVLPLKCESTCPPSRESQRRVASGPGFPCGQDGDGLSPSPRHSPAGGEGEGGCTTMVDWYILLDH